MARGKTSDLIYAAIKREMDANPDKVVAFSDEEILELISRHFKKNPSIGAVKQSRYLMAKSGKLVEWGKVGNNKLWSFPSTVHNVVVETPKEKESTEVRDEKPDTTPHLNEFSIDDVVHTLDSQSLIIDALMTKINELQENLMAFRRSADDRANDMSKRHSILLDRMNGIFNHIEKATIHSNQWYENISNKINIKFSKLDNYQTDVLTRIKSSEDAWIKTMQKADDITEVNMLAYKDGVKDGVSMIMKLNDEAFEKKQQESVASLAKIIKQSTQRS